MEGNKHTHTHTHTHTHKSLKNDIEECQEVNFVLMTKDLDKNEIFGC